MRPKASPNYLAAYPADVVAQVHRLIEQGRLGNWLLQKYPQAHTVRTDKALYDYVSDLKNSHLRNAGQLSKVMFDSRLQVIANALGTHTSISRVQGSRLQAKREIRIASIFRNAPEAFLRMIAVHELAHTKVREHDKAFYQLCQHMAPDYHQLEFELRVYLSHLDAGGPPLWEANASETPARQG